MDSNGDGTGDLEPLRQTAAELLWVRVVSVLKPELFQKSVRSLVRLAGAHAEVKAVEPDILRYGA